MQENKLAPIVLFVYSRLNLTMQTVEALKKNKLADQSDLFIFSDGPKDEDTEQKVKEVREYIREIKGFKTLNICERKENFGLANSIITGVTDIINKSGKIIVLEDDIITSEDFLLYMNKALNFYENQKNVFSITGYSFTSNNRSGKLDDYYFIKMGDCWSWATWADRWKYFDKDATGWEELKYNKKLRYEFNFSNSYNYYNMLKSQMENSINSWAIRWYWSVFRQGGLTLYPQKSLIKNIGLDGSGVHCDKGYIKSNFISIQENTFRFPSIASENPKIRAIMIKEMKKQRPIFYKRIVLKAKAFLKKIMK